MIEVNNLVKRYGDHTAVDHLSFKIEKGKIYGFLGPNGAGKSTTMNMITGYIASTEGTVTIDGHDILDEPEQAKKCIGYLPEMPPLYFDMTVGEYMNFVADLKKIPKDQKKSMVEEVMEMVKITDMKNRLIKNLSKGYRQRVGLAQAILGYPEVIILDEPTVGLDPKHIIEILDLIKSLKKKHTVILSSHILSEVQAICEKVLIIAKGKLVAFDAPENLEKLLLASNGITFTAEASVEEVDEIMKGIEPEVQWECGEAEDGMVLVRVKTESAEVRELCRQIFFAFAGKQRAILEMTSKKANLEDVFIELTEGDASAVQEESEEESLPEGKNTDESEVSEA